VWHENGQLMREGHYTNGKKNGIHSHYTEKGVIEKKEIWENGVLK
jgi:antitoxin component YwqK of YwqJK toxin-antitoxin module